MSRFQTISVVAGAIRQPGMGNEVDLARRRGTPPSIRSISGWLLAACLAGIAVVAQAGAIADVPAGSGHAIGGTVTGLAGGGLVLTLNASEQLPITADGTFTFATPVASGSHYTVTVGAQPTQPAQSCVVINGSGSVGSFNVTNVVVHCGAAQTYQVGGTLVGLAAGSSVTLAINGGNPLQLAANGAFVFAPAFVSGDAYSASVAIQPSGQHCIIANGEGSIVTASVSNLQVSCTSGGPQLQLSVSDGGEYARYGQVRDYFVTLTNTGTATASQVAVSASLAAAFDEANVQWACVNSAPDAHCTAEGTGALMDTATVPAGASLVWIVQVPIRADSIDDSATFVAHASGAADASDTNTLVIFRDGVDVPYADGADVEDPDSHDAATVKAESDGPSR